MTEGEVRRWADAYYHWLEAQIRQPGHQYRTYTDLFKEMFAKEFIWIADHDDNRIQDGLDLRTEFIYDHDEPGGLTPAEFGPASFLEVLVGLSRRVAFHAGGSAEEWAWQLCDNLELSKMSDPLSRRKREQVDQILEGVIWRNYSTDGRGGFFPLQQPDEDQTKLEIWDQMNAYIEEIHPEG